MKSSQCRMLWNVYASDEAFPLEALKRNGYPDQHANVNRSC